MSEPKHEVIFDEDTHRYTVDGVEVPSVTHLCRFLFVDIAAKAKDWLRDIAADRGSRIHAYTVMLDYGEEPEEIDQNCVGYLIAYRRFLKDYHPRWEGIETVMGGKNIGYAGTCDRYGYIQDRSCVLDIKTGSTIHKVGVATQLDGYWWLLANFRSFCAEDSYCLHLHKDGTYDLLLIDRNLSCLVECKKLHRALTAKKGKRNEQ